MNTMALSSTGQHWTASPGFADEEASAIEECEYLLAGNIASRDEGLVYVT